MTGPWISGESLSPSRLNLHAGAATLPTGYSTDTVQGQSGLTVNIISDLSVQNTAVAQRIELGGAPSSTSGLLSLRANSAQTDYLFLQDATGAKSNFLLGLRTGDSNFSQVDGLNLYDASDNTMIVRFSSDSVRFYPPIIAPVFDTGGALAGTYNAALYQRGGSKESQVQAAIAAAAADGIPRVYVPANLYPYSAASVSFDTRVQMVREGGNWAVHDVIAYGAAGNDITNDTAAIQSAISNSPVNGGVVYLPSNNYSITQALHIYGKRQFSITGGGTLRYSNITALVIADDGTNDSYNVLVNQLNFDGKSGTSSVAIFVTNLVHDCAQTHIRDCSIYSSPIGIHTTVGNGSGPHEVYVEDCIISNKDISNSTGIWFQSGDNSILNTVVRGYDIGIKLESGSHQLVGNHMYLFPGTTHKRDIQCEAARCSLVDNFFDGACSQAYLSLSAFYARGTSVTGNLWLATAAAGPCILFEQPGVPSTAISDFAITGNVFHADAAKTNAVSVDTYVVSHTGTRVYIEKNTFPYGIVTPFGTDPELRQVATFASPNFDPDLSLGRTIELTLTGNTQVRGPVSNSLGLFQGSTVKFIFIQDATGGRSVTWNSNWKHAWSDAGNVAGKRSSIVFQYNTAAVWEQVGAQSPYV